jgi:hypothetical protein
MAMAIVEHVSTSVRDKVDKFRSFYTTGGKVKCSSYMENGMTIPQ